jgi:hypothetical protein
MAHEWVSVFADDECGELVCGNADETAFRVSDVVALVRDALGRIPRGSTREPL